MRHSSTPASSIEILEARIAPAVIIAANGKSATFTDVDGDKVTITISKGDLNDATFDTQATGMGDQLQTLGLNGLSQFTGANITFKAVRTAGAGDGKVNVGYIDATGIDVGAVVVPGDLGLYDAGSNSETVLATKSLTVDSMGRFGLTTQDTVLDNIFSTIFGKLGTLTVKTNLDGVNFAVGKSVGAINIGGSVIGSSADQGGKIVVIGDVGTVKIGGDLRAGSGDETGRLLFNKVGSLTIGGSVFGGSDATPDDRQQITVQQDSGSITIKGDLRGGSADRSGGIENVNGSFKSITIGGNVTAGSGELSGSIVVNKDLGTLKIGGNLQASAATDSGMVRVGGKIGTMALGGSLIGGAGDFDTNENSEAQVRAIFIGTVTVGQDVVGGAGDGSGRITSLSGTTSVTVKGSVIGGTGTRSGTIASTSPIGSVTIGVDLVGDDDFSSGGVEAPTLSKITINGSIRSGLIYATANLGSLTVKGSILGTATDRAIISSPGTGVLPLAMKSISVTGNVEFTDIAGGYIIGTASNADAQIGSVTVGGDWIASNLVAGVLPVTGGFGTADDIKIAGGSSDVISKIGSIVIKGQAYGTFDGSGHFGFVAQQIGSFKLGGTTIELLAGAFNDSGAAVKEIGAPGNLTIREISA